MRKRIVAGNWKMNLLSAEALELAKALKDYRFDNDDKKMMIFPPSLFVKEIIDALPENTPLIVGTQNFYPENFGAFTGENSITQYKSIGLNTVLIGHSERREIFHEDDAFIKTKVNAAIEHAMNPIFCCGEPLEVREKNEQNDFVQNQLEASLFHLNTTQFASVVIAYEPIWAIGTGKTASATQAEDMHQHIRNLIQNKYGTSIAENTSILYGGSCKPNNAKELFAMPNIDGGLIGGAALNVEDFIAIANAL